MNLKEFLVKPEEATVLDNLAVCMPPKRYPASNVLTAIRDNYRSVMWRREERDGRTTKIPYQTNGYKASATNGRTWTTFQSAYHAFKSGKFDGIGYVVRQGDGILFIDLDHCIDEHGELSAIAEEFVNALGSGPDVYCELSQSGTGLHFLLHGVTIPTPSGRPNGSYHNKDADVEFYDNARYCALTGRQIVRDYIVTSKRIDGTRLEGVQNVNLKQNVLDLWAKYNPHADKPRTGERDLTLDAVTGIDSDYALRKCMQGRHGETFRQLYFGGYEGLFGSHSEADLFMCGQLAFWTDCNVAQIDGIFRSSALMRDKWLRDDYRERTIREAIDGCRESISEFRARVERERRERRAENFFNQ